LSVDVNVLIFYLSPKSFYPDVALCPATAVHDLSMTKFNLFLTLSLQRISN